MYRINGLVVDTDNATHQLNPLQTKTIGTNDGGGVRLEAIGR